MTTIAYDGRFVAGDGRSDLHDIIVSTTSKKIHIRPGYVYAFAGTLAIYGQVIAWIEQRDWSKPVPTAPEATWQALIFSARDGKIISEHASSEVPFPLEFEGIRSLGSGTQFAAAILEDGGMARRAVEIACKLDPWSGGEIQVVDIAEALGLNVVREAAE